MAEKIKCDCGITFRPEEGQTHCNYCGIKLPNISKKKINSKREQQKQSEKINYSSFLSTHSVLIILLILLLSSVGYLYAKNERLERNPVEKKQSLNPEPMPTALQPTPTLKPIVKEYIAPIPTLNPDPLINCTFSLNCAGQSLRLKNSECKNAVCCQLGNKWVAYTSSEKCRQDQGASASHNYNPPTSYPPCTIYYPALGYSKTYNYTSPEDCEQAKKNLTILVAPVVSPTPILNQGAIDEYNQLVKDHQAACLAAVSEWNTIKEQFMTTQYNNYSSSAEAVMALEKMRQNYQQEMYDAGCSNSISL